MPGNPKATGSTSQAGAPYTPAVPTAGLADDTKVVHLAGTETVTGKKTFNADIEFLASRAIIMRSPNGTRWKLTPSDAGASVWTAV